MSAQNNPTPSDDDSNTRPQPVRDLPNFFADERFGVFNRAVTLDSSGATAGGAR